MMPETFEHKGKIYDVTWKSKDTRHGGPFDRGSADSYYGRRWDPHFYIGGTGTSDRVSHEQMTQDEIDAYDAGFEFNEEFGDKKEW